MSSLEIGTDVILGRTTHTQRRKAALRIADQIGREHPHLTAEQIAADPLLAQGVRELLDAVFGNNPPRRTP